VIESSDREAHVELTASSILDPYIASPSQSQNHFLVMLGTSTKKQLNYFSGKHFMGPQMPILQNFHPL
jgi:hypothetical protein